jgi:hypothetical protein
VFLLLDQEIARLGDFVGIGRVDAVAEEFQREAER